MPLQEAGILCLRQVMTHILVLVETPIKKMLLYFTLKNLGVIIEGCVLHTPFLVQIN